MGKEFRPPYSPTPPPPPSQLRRREPYPTIYMPLAQIDGPSTLPPPQRQPEREGTDVLAVGRARKFGSAPFAALDHCRREGKGWERKWALNPYLLLLCV